MGINPIGQVISLWAHLLFMYGMCVLVISILLYVDLVTDEIDLKNKGSVKSMMLFIIVGSILSLISNSALVATRKPTITITAGISAVLSFVIMAIASFIYDGIASSKNLNYKDSTHIKFIYWMD